MFGMNWFGALLAWFARCAFTSGAASSPSLRRRAVAPNWRFSLVIVLRDDGTGRARRWSMRGADILLYSILWRESYDFLSSRDEELAFDARL